MKTYVLMISRTFPAYHPRKGESTAFVEQIFNEITPCGLIEKKTIEEHGLDVSVTSSKRHTIRANYELWKKRIDKVQKGESELSLRYWSGSPYNWKKDGSKQVEFCRLGKDDGVGIQRLRFHRIIELP